MNTLAAVPDAATDEVARYARELGVAARAAAREVARSSTATRNAALVAIAAALREGAADIVAANRGDIARAEAEGRDAAFVDRLALDAAAVAAMADGVDAVAALPDPIGAISALASMPSGIEVGRMRVPLGVIGIIYESRPDVTADAANGNRLLFSYKRAGSATSWGVAFAGRFTTKGGSIIGYSAELYDDAGKISSRFAFDFKGRIKDGSTATRNTLQFAVAIAGQTVDLTLSGTFNFTKSSLTFALKLNTSTRTGEISSLSFGVKLATTDGKSVDLRVAVDGSVVTISLKVGADITLGGSRKGSVYAFLDMKLDGETVGIDAMIGITLN